MFLANFHVFPVDHGLDDGENWYTYPIGSGFVFYLELLHCTAQALPGLQQLSAGLTEPNKKQRTCFAAAGWSFFFFLFRVQSGVVAKLELPYWLINGTSGSSLRVSRCGVMRGG